MLSILAANWNQFKRGAGNTSSQFTANHRRLQSSGVTNSNLAATLLRLLVVFRRFAVGGILEEVVSAP